MALDNYSDFAAAIADQLARTDLTSQIVDCITLFEAEASVELFHHRLAEKTTILIPSNPGELVISSIVGNSSNQARVTVTSPLQTTTTTGTEIRLSGSSNYDGTWGITVISGTVFDLQGSTCAGPFTAVASASGGAISRGTVGRSSGKYYFEAMLNSSGGTANGLGVINASQGFFDFIGDTGNNAIGFYNDAFGIYINNVNVLNWPNSFAVGDTIGVAIDLTSQLAWFYAPTPNLWNNSASANPATGIGGISISAISGALYPAIDQEANGASWTINLGASSFANAQPSGFTSWGGSLDPANSYFGLTLSVLDTGNAQEPQGQAQLPSDFLGWRRVTWTGNPQTELEYVHPQVVAVGYPNSSPFAPLANPRVFTIEGSTLKIMPVSGTPIEFDYWSKNSAIASSLNWLFSNRQDCYWNGVLEQCYTYVKDYDQAAVFQTKKLKNYADIKLQQFREPGKLYIRAQTGWSGNTP